MPDERSLALELDRALAGEDVGAEARELAALLRAAAEPTRFELADAEIEHGLARARPRGRREPGAACCPRSCSPRRSPASSRRSGSSARRRRTSAGRTRRRRDVLRRRAVRPARAGPSRHGHLGLRRRSPRQGAHPRLAPPGRGRTRVQLDGSVERWLRASNTLTLSPSCASWLRRAPRHSIRSPSTSAPTKATPCQAARLTYRLSIGSGRVEETVVVDRRRTCRSGSNGDRTGSRSRRRASSPSSGNASDGRRGMDDVGASGAKVVQLTREAPPSELRRRAPADAALGGSGRPTGATARRSSR